MTRIGTVILAAIVGGMVAVLLLVGWADWGVVGSGQKAHLDPTRADYIDLLLVIATLFLGAIGLAVTVGALVVGLVALKSLREIKTEAARNAEDAASRQIKDTMDRDLEPNVTAKVHDALPSAIQAALLQDELAHRIFGLMADRGELDVVLERVAMRMQGGGISRDPDEDDELSDG